ncbi:MAG TPA: delta-60 repeat domain-containing protein, partial [Solirubrobacteraceae bacterium]|nr:delta-60 repeat domain-containing protein [Solirubrobacteraceae bacterium]
AVPGDDSETGVADVVEIEPDGAPDPSFGDGGVARVSAGFPRLHVEQIVRAPDGTLILVGAGTRIDNVEASQLVLVRLNADGTLDQSFGAGGVDRLPIASTCKVCAALAARPGGGFVVTGSTQAPADVPSRASWIVAGLTSTGALDPSFGAAGIATVSGIGTDGTDLAVLPDGAIVTLGGGLIGTQQYGSELGRLLASGAPDPAFHGGTLEVLPNSAEPGGMLAYADGSVVVDLDHALVRYTAAGLPDQAFGSGGIVQLDSPELHLTAQLLPSAGDGAVVVLRNPPVSGVDQVERIGATGTVDPTLGGPTGKAFDTPFGGGESGFLGRPVRYPLLDIDQNTFTGSAVQRPDGTVLLVGDVAVSQPTGQGIGHSIDHLAATALTSSFAPDTSFGGRVDRLRVKLTFARQRAATARTRHAIRVTLDVSAPGLARVVIRAGGRVVAQNLLPVLAARPTSLPVELTSFGARWLRTHPRGRLTATIGARDLLTNTAATTATGRLR